MGHQPAVEDLTNRFPSRDIKLSREKAQRSPIKTFKLIKLMHRPQFQGSRQRSFTRWLRIKTPIGALRTSYLKYRSLRNITCLKHDAIRSSFQRYLNAIKSIWETCLNAMNMLRISTPTWSKLRRIQYLKLLIWSPNPTSTRAWEPSWLTGWWMCTSNLSCSQRLSS